ncbi:MAG: cation-translocating P-type ATPase [Candidatus Lokiarchaeota archaeon]|nr:cation-translocating P-type ATPase [Candidatus Lokiarchaeota archaeon]
MSNLCKSCEESIIKDDKNDIRERNQKLVIIIVSSLLLAISLIYEFVIGNFLYNQIFAAIVTIISGAEVMYYGLKKLLQKQITINFLMTIATIGAFLIGHGGEGAVLMLLYYIAEFLEDYAKDKSKKSISSLMKITPETTFVKKNNEFTELHTHDVSIGDIIQIKPGEIISLDGIIIYGSSNINEASLTGESIPVFKKIGNEVLAGTINCDGYLEIKITATYDKSFISKIKELIENAKNQKSSTELFVDQFAKYYTPIMVILTFFIMFIMPLLIQQSYNLWIYRGLTLLVISCPCAIALATPISTITAIISAAKHGILIKGGKYIEEMAKINSIAFDKTGTLTHGIIEVKDILSYDGTIENWFGIVYGLELLSEHPISKAIITEAKKRHINPSKIENFKAIIGKGVSGNYNQKEFLLGNKQLFKNINHPNIKNKELLDTYNEKSILFFGDKEKILGSIILQDKMREESKEVIEILKRQKIKTILISGDNKNTVIYAQKRLDVNEFHYELKPHEKQHIIQQKKDNRNKIAMIGDGINDAPSLALANVGIAMGGIGSDVSMETADVILVKDNLKDILSFLEVSKKTASIIKFNIIFSILIKILFVFLTFLGFMTLYIAVGIGDLGLTLFVILNAFRISKIKFYSKNPKKNKSIINKIETKYCSSICNC